jgi:hypothetical protein
MAQPGQLAAAEEVLRTVLRHPDAFIFACAPLCLLRMRTHSHNKRNRG